MVETFKLGFKTGNVSKYTMTMDSNKKIVRYSFNGNSSLESLYQKKRIADALEIIAKSICGVKKWT